MLVWHSLPAQELNMVKVIKMNKKVEDCVVGKGL